MVGTPIGSDKFCLDFWTEKLLDPIMEAVPLVCQWSNVQAALCLFLLCINHKCNYFLRNTDPTCPQTKWLVDHINLPLKIGLAYLLQRKVDVTNVDTVQQDLDTFMSEEVWAQAVLPASMGGLGIIDPTQHHIPAYIASTIAAIRNLYDLLETHTLLLSHTITPTSTFICPSWKQDITPAQIVGYLPQG